MRRWFFTKRNTEAAVFLLVALLFLPGCWSSSGPITDPEDPQFVVASGKGFEITRQQLDDFGAYIARLRKVDLRRLNDERRELFDQTIVELLVVETIIVNGSKDLPREQVDAEVDKYIDSQIARFPSRAEFEKWVGQIGLTPESYRERVEHQVRLSLSPLAAKPLEPPTNEDITAFYNENIDQFKRPEKLRTSTIMFSFFSNTDEATKEQKRAAAKAARERVLGGEDFGKVASEVSEDQGTKAKAGDEGFFMRGMRFKEYEDVAFSLDVGEVSPLFEVSNGVYFLKVTGRQPEGMIELKYVYDQIKTLLVRQMAAEHIRNHIEKLLTDHDARFFIQRRSANSEEPRKQPQPERAEPKQGQEEMPPAVPLSERVKKQTEAEEQPSDAKSD